MFDPDPALDAVLDPDPDPEDPDPPCSPVVESVRRCSVGLSGSVAGALLAVPDPELELDPLPEPEVYPELELDPLPESAGGRCAKCGFPSSGAPESWTNCGSVFDVFSFATFGCMGC